VLDKKLREDLRAVGTTIGTIFYKDVTLISKLVQHFQCKRFQRYSQCRHVPLI